MKAKLMSPLYVYGNGNLEREDLLGATVRPLWNEALSGAYVVGVTDTDGVNGFGVWTEEPPEWRKGNTIHYVDPIRILYSEQEAVRVGKIHKQTAVFRIETVLRVNVLGDATPEEVLTALEQESDATAIKTLSFGWVLFVAQGELLYI